MNGQGSKKLYRKMLQWNLLQKMTQKIRILEANEFSLPAYQKAGLGGLFQDCRLDWFDCSSREWPASAGFRPNEESNNARGQGYKAVKNRLFSGCHEKENPAQQGQQGRQRIKPHLKRTIGIGFEAPQKN